MLYEHALLSQCPALGQLDRGAFAAQRGGEVIGGGQPCIDLMCQQRRSFTMRRASSRQAPSTTSCAPSLP